MIVLSNALQAVAVVISGLLSLYFWIVIIATVLTWVRPDPYNPIVRVLRQLTEPVFYRVRKWLPFTYTSGLDFSPVVVLLAIELFNRIVIKSILEYSSTMRKFETLCVSNHTACRFAEKTRFFRSLWAGRRCAAVSRFTFFKVETF